MNKTLIASGVGGMIIGAVATAGVASIQAQSVVEVNPTTISVSTSTQYTIQQIEEGIIVSSSTLASFERACSANEAKAQAQLSVWQALEAQANSVGVEPTSTPQ